MSYSQRIVLLCAVVFAGCSMHSVPDCADKLTTDLVIKIAKGETEKMFHAHKGDIGELARFMGGMLEEDINKIVWSVDNIITTDKNEKTGSYACKAELKAATENGDSRIQIEYTSDLTSEKKLYVEVNGVTEEAQAKLLSVMVKQKTTSQEKTEQSIIAREASSSTTELPLSDAKEGDSYENVRTKMLAAGWKPYHSADADTCGDNDTRCKNRPEMLSCAGTGMANCKFIWKKNEKTVGVCTVGEDVIFDGFCSGI